MNAFRIASHVEGVCQLRCDFQNLGKRCVREAAIERVVDIDEGHAIRQTFEDERYRETGTSNGEFAAQ